MKLRRCHILLRMRVTYGNCMKIYKEHFGKKLREATKAAGVTQAKLAEAVGVEPPAVSRWVNGLDFPDDSRMGPICEFLKVEPEFFGYGNAEMSASDLLDLLQANKDILLVLPKIPRDVLKLLSRQDDIYFASLRRVLEGLEAKKNPKATRASNS